MNSYPPELLAQLAPVMFVAGLDASPSAPSTSNSQAHLPSTPTTPKAQDFGALISRLREALQSQRKVAVWQPEKAKTFQVILVDKDVRFPSRKLVPPDDPHFHASHSPLSPLTPSSPLYPDGLMAPIWVRKHTVLVPSVFVLFLRIFEYPLHNPRSPLDGPDVDHEREREQEERRRDTELAAEIALRKRSTNERGIKLTVVLMASRRMLDDPTLDARLTYIRRQSGLDSRAALFVLSPVSPAELSDFVKSLQQALYESALEYYTAHSKRVRRKRNRHAQAVPHPATTPSVNPTVPRPLRPEGWTVRYEFKMACFAEFRGEDEVALKHYQDAHAMLVVMFGSTAILPPRTKRWAEAKVLADCINTKISKLYLYNNEHALALSHHNAHVRMFSDFSRGWGIGEETFEYWSWMARQHRVLAELLEQGTRSTLTIPIHKPSIPNAMTASQAPIAGASRNLATTAPELDQIRSLGINPSHSLQHPGFYYYMAAKCTEMRRIRFMTSLEAEQTQPSATLSPGFANEKKVDHLTIILELYTKAYELFKKYSTMNPQNPTQGRFTLWIAYLIAQTYYDSGKYDMAVRFFERIAKTYRRERWGPLLHPLLLTWYTCTQKLGDVELSVKLLVELLGHDVGTPDQANSTEDDLLAILKSAVPSSDDVLVVDLPDSDPIFDSNVIFWDPEVKVGEAAAFQISLTAPRLVSVSSLPFSSLAIYFSHLDFPVVIQHDDVSITSWLPFKQVNLGHINGSGAPQETTANLRWGLGGCIVFSGTVSSDVPAHLEVSKLILAMNKDKWHIEVPFSPSISRESTSHPAKWLVTVDPLQFIPMNRGDTSLVVVQHRPHNLVISLTHHSPAYLDEKHPITLEITNADDRTLDILVDALLQPTDDAFDTIIIDDEQSSGFIKGVDFGSLSPGVSIIKTLYLVNTGASGDRMIDLSIQSKPTSDSEPILGLETQDVTETLRTMTVPTVEPFKVTQNVSYTQSSGNWHGLADLRTFNADFWDANSGSEAIVDTIIECAGSSGLWVESIELERQNFEYAKVIDCSADEDKDNDPTEYLPGDQLRHVCRLALVSVDEPGLEEGISSPAMYLVNWRRSHKQGDHSSSSTTKIPLPPLQRPTDGLIALLTVPSKATLHTPSPIVLSVRNSTSLSANILAQLEPDPSDGFVVAGLRSGRIPTLMPGAEEMLTWNLIPIECGHVKIPRIKVTNRRKHMISGVEPTSDIEEKGEAVRVIDVRMVQRPTADGSHWEGDQQDLGAILVLPY